MRYFRLVLTLGIVGSLELDDTNYEKFIGQCRHAVALFYGEGMESQEMLSQWDFVWNYFNKETSDEYNEDVVIVRANTELNTKIKQKLGIGTVPVIGFFPAGSIEKASAFSKSSEKVVLIEWIEEELFKHLGQLEKARELGVKENSTECLESTPAVEYEFEILVDEPNLGSMSKWKGEFQSIHIELQELKSYFLDEIQSISSFTKSVKTIFQGEAKKNIERFSILENRVETIDYNVRNKSQLVSTQSRFNVKQVLIFIGVGIVVGLLIGIFAVRMKEKGAYSRV